MSLKTFNITYTKEEKKETFAYGKVGVIITAAGSASRMEGQNKILASLVGIPVIARTIMAFQDILPIEKIVVVTREDMVADIQNLVAEYNLFKVSDIVVGGPSRQESVRNGFYLLGADADIKTVLIHDGARPLVSSKVIEGVISAAEEFGAAIPVVAPKDTVKVTGALGKVINTPDRSTLCLVQTPQGFKTENYKKALESAEEELANFTDDSSVVENAGITVYTTLGDYKNIKITTPEDLELASAFLKREENL